MIQSPFGEYLRARRQLVRPEDVGLPADDNRRVAGLRRLEVANLAGISAEYYLRLEQGRDRQPSAQVLNALGRALRLDDSAVEYMHRLVHPNVAEGRHRAAANEVADSLRMLMGQWTHTPAHILNRSQDVLACNPLAAALVPGVFEPGSNLLRSIFGSGSRVHDPNWEALASGAVATLRYNADPSDPRLQQVVGELLINEPDFRRLWARHDAQPLTTGTAFFTVETFGVVELRWQALTIPDHSGNTLITYFGAAGTRGETAMVHLHDTVVASGSAAPRGA
ncbi:helix-turn-helix domain-containing protein [Cryobacterium sp. AP23]